MDVRVLVRVLAGQVADADRLRPARGEVEQALGDELVVEDEVGAGEHLGGADGEQPRTAGAGADQEDIRLCGIGDHDVQTATSSAASDSSSSSAYPGRSSRRRCPSMYSPNIGTKR